MIHVSCQLKVHYTVLWDSCLVVHCPEVSGLGLHLQPVVSTADQKENKQLFLPNGTWGRVALLICRKGLKWLTTAQWLSDRAQRCERPTAWVTAWCYLFKVELENKRRCEACHRGGLVQRLNIRAAHIGKEKQAESPTQTSLWATEAQRPSYCIKDSFKDTEVNCVRPGWNTRIYTRSI